MAFACTPRPIISQTRRTFLYGPLNWVGHGGARRRTLAETQQLVADRMEQIVDCAATAATILAPSIQAVGGGLSRNPSFSKIVVDEFCQLNSRTKIAVSSKGVEASVDGAVRLARDLGWTSLVGTYYHPALGRPTIYQGSRL